MTDNDPDGMAPRFRPSRWSAPFDRVTAGDREVQIAGVRASRAMGRWRCTGVVWVAGAIAVVPVVSGRPDPVSRTGWTTLALVLAVVGGIACWAGRSAARRRLRLVDESAGFPVPGDLAVVLGTAAEPLLALYGWHALPDAGLDTPARQVLHASTADVRAVEVRMLADLHRARLAWVAGDAPGWRRATMEAADSARRAHTVYADVRSSATLPPPDTPATPV